MLKFTLKYPTLAPTCFGPPGPSSGSLYSAWLKLHFCRSNQYKYIVISCAVLWQRVFQAVVCVLCAGQHAALHTVHTTALNTRCHNTAQLITL